MSRPCYKSLLKQPLDPITLIEPMKPISHILADDTLIAPYAGASALPALAGRLSAFIRQQLATWPELREAHNGLQQSLYKKIFLNDLEVELQHNPYRMKSSSALVDRQSIEKRPCFLCPDNLYPHQRALAYRDEWLVLCNPYPIFADHLVISHADHRLQEIASCLGAMISFVADSKGMFETFYNGPACGASAPDHLHFQAYPAGGGIPLVPQVQLLLAAGMGLSQTDAMHGQGACFAGEVDCRAVFICRSPDSAALEAMLIRAVSHLKNVTRAQDEPLVNILIAADGPDLIGILLPRKAHRPACYFSQAGDHMVVSPGAVDAGGLLVLPRREDYERMTREQVLGIFSEVCHGKDIFEGFSFQ
jgi:hypothetical protein